MRCKAQCIQATLQQLWSTETLASCHADCTASTGQHLYEQQISTVWRWPGMHRPVQCSQSAVSCRSTQGGLQHKRCHQRRARQQPCGLARDARVVPLPAAMCALQRAWHISQTGGLLLVGGCSILTHSPAMSRAPWMAGLSKPCTRPGSKMYGSECDLRPGEPTACSALQAAKQRHQMLGLLLPGSIGSCLQGLARRVRCLRI